MIIIVLCVFFAPAYGRTPPSSAQASPWRSPSPTVCAWIIWGRVDSYSTRSRFFFHPRNVAANDAAFSLGIIRLDATAKTGLFLCEHDASAIDDFILTAPLTQLSRLLFVGALSLETLQTRVETATDGSTFAWLTRSTVHGHGSEGPRTNIAKHSIAFRTARRCKGMILLDNVQGCLAESMKLWSEQSGWLLHSDVVALAPIIMFCFARRVQSLPAIMRTQELPERGAMTFCYVEILVNTCSSDLHLAVYDWGSFALCREGNAVSLFALLSGVVAAESSPSEVFTHCPFVLRG